MDLLSYSILALSSLFVIVDPLGAVPTFLAMTAHNKLEERARMARLACTVAACILTFIAASGMLVFRVFSITLPAFQIAGSFILLLVGHDMLRGKRSTVKETSEEREAGTMKDDIAITPLAVPMLAGPGAITTTVILRNKAETLPSLLVLMLVILTVCLASYIILRLALRSAKWISPIAMRIAMRLMGLLLSAVAVQFFLNALKELRIIS